MLRKRIAVGLLVGAMGTTAWVGGCSSSETLDAPENMGIVRQAGDWDLKGDCQNDGATDTLVQFAEKCDSAIGVSVPAFDCDQGTLVPETDLVPADGRYPNQDCNAPNVLDHACDPGSRFQVLRQTDDVSIVGHCRKKGNGANYGDIAVIQYNRINGATCFYQAFKNGLPAKVTAPRDPNGPSTFPWLSPKETAAINCVRCHDNGPFVRSPYLAQLRNEPKNRLPGTNPGSGPFDNRFSWNSTLPYSFIGSDFQSWKAYRLGVTTAGSECSSCHLLGMSASRGKFNTRGGTSLQFAEEATAEKQTHKHEHSDKSPIWMEPDQIKFDLKVHKLALENQACAQMILKRSINPSAPNPSASCTLAQFAQGNTCKGPDVTITVNGATQSAPGDQRVDVTGTVGVCPPGTSGCRPGFCYWRTLHGPFWQKSGSNIPVGDNDYRGSFIRIFVEKKEFKYRFFSDTTPEPAMAAPGGQMDCVFMSELNNVPNDIKECRIIDETIADKDGQLLFHESRPFAPVESVNFLTGFIGNVSQANNGDMLHDFLKTYVTGGKVYLEQTHMKQGMHFRGPLMGEAFATQCNGWTPEYAVRDVFTESDVELVPAPAADKVRCFITGISGAWSSTRDNGNTQPYAEIYQKGSSAGNTWRLRVSPSVDGLPLVPLDRVGASASCIVIK